MRLACAAPAMRHGCGVAGFVLASIAACAAQRAVSAAPPGTARANDDAPLVDMRDPVFLRPPTLSDTERQQVLAAASDAASGGETTINSVVHGAFTAHGRNETVYLLQRGGPQAADPSGPQGATLAVFADGRLQARLGTDAGNFIQASPDVDGDGVDELLLRVDSYQMGVGTTRLSLVSLAQGRVTVVAPFPEARVDRCGDTRFGGDVEAVVIHRRPAPGEAKQEFAIERYTGRCVDGEPPSADKFHPMRDP